MAAGAYQTSNFAYQGAGAFAYQDAAGEATPVVDALLGGGWEAPYRRKRLDDEKRRAEQEQRELLETIALEHVITRAEQKKAKKRVSKPGYLTLDEIIGQKAVARMATAARIELEAKIQHVQRMQQIRREDDELLLM
jgi:hypothetical protein